MIETVSERRNGVGAPMPIKSVLIDCTEAGYPGWHARLRINIPARVYDEFLSPEPERFWRSLSAIVVEWNFADEDGKPLPTPQEGLEWVDLPFDLANYLVRAYVAAFTAATAVPKASDASSDSTSTTVADPPTGEKA